MDGWAKIPQASRYAGTKPRTVRTWLKSGLQHSRLPSGLVLIRYTDLDAFLQKFQVNNHHIENLVDQAVKELYAK